MDDDLLAYYNGELTFIREMGAEFAAKYPKVAARLLLDADKCEDPHVERLLEGFAFLAARVRQKIDDEFPEITDALLGALYPHFQRPVPSMSVVQFLPGADPLKLAGGYVIGRGARLNSRPVGGFPCQFRTAYPVTLWPVEVESVRLDPDRVVFPGKRPEAVALLRLRLRGPEGMSFGRLGLDRLRFYLDGEGPLVRALYELLFRSTCQVLLQGQAPGGPAEVVALPAGSIREVGFGRDEGMLPYPDRAFPGYRLLQEYFAFPEKFLFFDVTGLSTLAGRGWGEAVDLLIFFDEPPRGELAVRPENFRLGCTPVVNLFTLVTEPILLNQTQVEYRVVPDVHRPMATEVYSVDKVTYTASFLDEPVAIDPFYELTRSREGEGDRAFWYANRRRSVRKSDPGTETYLTFVDPGFNPRRPAAETLTLHATCTNRDLPARLPFGGGQSDFELESQGPVSRVRCLRKPTPSLRPPLGRGAQWALVSHLSLNHLSLADSAQGLEALRAILRLYDLADSAANRQQISGITRVSGRRAAGRVGRSACLGVEVTLEFDEGHYVGSGVLLLASVLERFFGMYASVNSFSQLVATTRQREGVLKRWPPRAGERVLL
jgi:type VI secretion system protein ImpG